MSISIKAMRAVLSMLGVVTMLLGCRITQNENATITTGTQTRPAFSATTGSTSLPTVPEQSPLPGITIAAQTPTLMPTPTPYPVVEFPLFGIEIHSRAELKKIYDSGARQVRRNALLWSLVEPVQGERNWSAIASLEAELMQASEIGLDMILIVRSTPTWAQKVPGVFCGAVREGAFEGYARFLADAVDRYSRPPYNVKIWELGNEPDIDPDIVPNDSIYGCMGDRNAPYYGGGQYGEMLKVVYPAMKAVNPEVQVLVGGLLLDCDPRNTAQGKDCSPSTFLEGILHTGAGDFFDGVSFHGYDYYREHWSYYNPGWGADQTATGAVLSVKAGFLREVLTAYGYGNKPLYLTEAALICGRTGKEPVCTNQNFEDTKAAHIIQSYVQASVIGVRSYIWYSLAGWRASGLVRSGGVPTQAYRAVQFAVTQIHGKTSLLPSPVVEGARAYAFAQENHEVWVLWSIELDSVQYELPSLPDAIYNLYGEELEPAKIIQVSPLPIYIVFSNT